MRTGAHRAVLASGWWDPAKKLRRRFLVAGMHSLPFEFPASLPPARPPRPPSVTESVERDAVLSGMRHLGSRKMRRFVNDNFLDAPVEMDESPAKPQRPPPRQRLRTEVPRR